MIFICSYVNEKCKLYLIEGKLSLDVAPEETYQNVYDAINNYAMIHFSKPPGQRLKNTNGLYIFFCLFMVFQHFNHHCSIDLVIRLNDFENY